MSVECHPDGNRPYNFLSLSLNYSVVLEDGRLQFHTTCFRIVRSCASVVGKRSRASTNALTGVRPMLFGLTKYSMVNFGVGSIVIGAGMLAFVL